MVKPLMSDKTSEHNHVAFTTVLKHPCALTEGKIK